MATQNWDNNYETTPAGSDLRSEGDDRIRDLKRDVRERLAQGGHVMKNATNTYDGRHAVDAGGVNVGPDIYKADTTTKLVTYTDSTVTVDANLVVNGTVVDEGGSLDSAQDVAGDVVVSFPIGFGDSGSEVAGLTITASATPRKVVVSFYALLRQNTPTPTLTGLKLQSDRGTLGVSWSDVTGLLGGTTIAPGSATVTIAPTVLDFNAATQNPANTDIQYRVVSAGSGSGSSVTFFGARLVAWEMP